MSYISDKVFLTLATSTGLTSSSSTDTLYVFWINWGLESPTANICTGTDELLGFVPPAVKRKMSHTHTHTNKQTNKPTKCLLPKSIYIFIYKKYIYFHWYWFVLPSFFFSSLLLVLWHCWEVLIKIRTYLLDVTLSVHELEYTLQHLIFSTNRHRMDQCTSCATTLLPVSILSTESWSEDTKLILRKKIRERNTGRMKNTSDAHARGGYPS